MGIRDFPDSLWSIILVLQVTCDTSHKLCMLLIYTILLYNVGFDCGFTLKHSFTPDQRIPYTHTHFNHVH